MKFPFLEGSEDRHEIKNLLDDRLTFCDWT